MPDRFFSETPIQPAQSNVTLRGDESQHLAVVLRAKAGTEIIVFDGSGAEWPGRVTAVSKSAVEVELGERRAAEPAASTLALAVALPKGDRQKWLVEKCVELGVARLVPLLTARGVAQPVENALARLKRAVIEASKQSGQLRLLEIAAPRAWHDFVQEPASPEVLRCVAQPQRAPETREVMAEVPLAAQTALWRTPREWLQPAAERIAAIGPEGGFTAVELRAAIDAGWQLLDLGSGILRVETAALKIAAWQGLEYKPDA
jgi:16S rRNA (uracil1498-N3)-methyltransferase